MNNNRKNSNLGIVLSQGEDVVQEIKKHPVGITFNLLIGASIIVVILAVSAIAYGFLRSADSNVGNTNTNAYGLLILLISIVLSAGVLIATLINIYLYKMNSLIVTTEKVAQIVYKNIFDRKVVQLSIERVQDVTVSQVGVLPRIFKYGTITIETAGEQEDCIFTFAPNPYEHSRTIMDLHEKAAAKSRAII